MNILHLISSGGYFGAENVVLQLAIELHKKNECSIVVGVFDNRQSSHIEVSELCRKRSIDTVVFPCRGRVDLKTIFQIRKFLQANAINITHSHGYKSNLYSYCASLGMTTYRVATCHNWLGDDLRMQSYAALDRFCLKKYDKIVAVSQDVKKKIISSGISPDKVTIVNNGIDINRFEVKYPVETIKEELGINKCFKVIGTVGRISAEKGHECLLRVAIKILKSNPEILFLIIGDGPLRTLLQKKYTHPSLIFTGFRNDLAHLYQCMDIFVLPSLTEGLPIVLLEAMASELPVIATDVGAVPIIITENQTGLLIKPNDEKALEDSLLFLLRNQYDARAMGASGYRLVKEHFSSRKMATNYLNLYSELTNK